MHNDYCYKSRITPTQLLSYSAGSIFRNCRVAQLHLILFCACRWVRQSLLAYVLTKSCFHPTVLPLYNTSNLHFHMGTKCRYFLNLADQTLLDTETKAENQDIFLHSVSGLWYSTQDLFRLNVGTPLGSLPISFMSSLCVSVLLLLLQPIPSLWLSASLILLSHVVSALHSVVPLYFNLYCSSIPSYRYPEKRQWRHPPHQPGFVHHPTGMCSIQWAGKWALTAHSTLRAPCQLADGLLDLHGLWSRAFSSAFGTTLLAYDD